MTVNRSHFERSYSEFPAWTCPTCEQGHLVLDKASFQNVETGPSKKAHDHPAWDVEWIENRFAGILICNFANCGELVAIGGSVTVEEQYEQDYDGEIRQIYVDTFEPRFIFPAPPLVRLIQETPIAVKAKLVEAAGLVWQNSEASANQVRQAVESLMDCQKVIKTEMQKGKRARLSLHRRIKIFEKSDPANAEILLAIKWLGNTGSHLGKLSRKDVFDAFDMIELVLTNLYSQSAKQIQRKAKAINKAKGPATP